MQMRRPLVYSLLLHGFVVLALGVSALTIHRAPPPIPLAVVVEAVPVSSLTNLNVAKRNIVPPKQENKKDISTKVLPPMAQPEPISKPQESKPEKKEKPKPEEKKKIESIKKAEKEPEKKPEPKNSKTEEPKKPEKKPEQADEFGALLKTVEAMQVPDEQEPQKAQDNFDDVEKAVAEHSDLPFNPELPLSVDEKQAIYQQIYRHWNIVSGGLDADKMIVVLRVFLAEDGTVDKVEVVDQARVAVDSQFRAAVDRAVLAVHKSSPIENLPKDKYHDKEGWKEMEIIFDPSKML
jgi:hypothetical protein